MKQETTTIKTTTELTHEQAREQNIAGFLVNVLSEAADRIAAITNELKAGKHGAIADLKEVVDEFTKVGVSTVNARDKFYKHFVGGGADEGSVELDLGAARAEIRRRMDRLRASFGAGGVSE